MAESSEKGMEKEKPKYKEIRCDICNKTYLNNYYYNHRKSVVHQKKMVAHDIKANLLKDEIPSGLKNNNIELLNNIKFDLQNIINYINENKNII